MAIDLKALYAELVAPEGAGMTFSARLVPGWPGVRVARTAEGPALLFEVGPRLAPRPNIELKHLRVLFATPCRITDETGTHELDLTAMICAAPEDGHRWLFFEAIEAALAGRTGLTDDEIGATIDALVEVFRALGQEPKASIIGVWGELYLISRSTDPDVAVRSWHATANDRYDFASDDVRIEVKTTTGQRRHRFSREQLRPEEPFDVVVASILTHSSAAGSTIGDLIRAVGARVSDKSLVPAMTASVAQALGSEAVAWRTSRYDVAAADSSVRFMRACDVPCVEDPPVDVFDVQLTVDLEAADPPQTPIEGHGALGVAMKTGEVHGVHH